MIRFIITLILFGYIYSQEKYFQLHDVYSNDSSFRVKVKKSFQHKFLMNELNEFIEECVTLSNDSGYLFTEVFIKDITIVDSRDVNLIDIIVQYNKSERVQIDTVTFSGASQTSYSNLLRQSRLELNTFLSPNDINEGSDWLAKSHYASSVLTYDLIKTKTGKMGLNYNLDELNLFFINGVIGYNPNATESAVAADFEMKYKNIAGSGRGLALKWNLINEKNNGFNINYVEPWLFTIPIDLDLSLTKQFRDSSYTSWNYKVGLSYSITSRLNIGISYDSKSITPVDSVHARELRLPVTDVITNSFYVNYSSLNRKINPSSGFLTTLKFSSSESKYSRPDWLIDLIGGQSSSKRTLEFDTGLFYNINETNVFYHQIEYAVSQGNQLNISDQYYIGGLNALRGFNEFHFKSHEYFLLTTEYRFLTGKRSRLFLFNDIAEINNDFHLSYGLGIRFEAPLGIMGVTFAIPNDQGFRGAKLHFGIYSDLD